jgi:hypothetical protein
MLALSEEKISSHAPPVLKSVGGLLLYPGLRAPRLPRAVKLSVVNDLIALLFYAVKPSHDTEPRP